MRIDWQYLLALAAVAFLLAIVSLFGSCKTVAPCVPETITRDSVRVEYKLDSVYLYERDSIFVHEKRDTVIDTKTEVQVQRVEVTPRFAKFCYWWFGVSTFLLIAGGVLWICKKFYVK